MWNLFNYYKQLKTSEVNFTKRYPRALIFKLMPVKTYVFQNGNMLSGKISDQSVTVFVSAISDGSEKLPLPLIMVRKISNIMML